MTHTRSDEKLMLANQSGEADAFAERYTRHKVPAQWKTCWPRSRRCARAMPMSTGPQAIL